MNAMTCNEVQEQLDLLAADACEPAVREALEGHLRECQACAAKFAESQRLSGLLDVHFSEKGIERLRQRIEQPARPTRRFMRPFVRGVLAAAAVVLIAIGLVWWLPKGDDDQPTFEPTFAMVVHARKQAIVPGPEKLPATIKAQNAEAMVVIPLVARGDKEFRDDLVKAKRGGKLPLPPLVSLDMELVNTSKRGVEIRPSDATLELDLPGDTVVRMNAPDAEEPDFLKPAKVQLDPGEKHIFHVDRLVAGSRGKLEFIYLTQPGDYVLTARLRISVAGQAIVVTAPSVRIGVTAASRAP